MRISLVGPGAIGTTVAAALHEAGREVTLCGRTPRDGLLMHAPDGDIAVPGPVLTDPSVAVSSGTPGVQDLVFLSVKATQTAGAAGWLSALCGPDTVVCVLQNGVEQVAAVQPLAPSSTVPPAVVWFPAVLQPDRSVLLRGEPRLSVPEGPGGQVVAGALAGSRCSVTVDPEFDVAAWTKLTQNALAGLMVLTGRTSGTFRRPDLAELAHAYATECRDVGRACGVPLPDDLPDRIVAKFQGFPVDMGTSILADRVAGHPLEWDVRNGVIRRLGHERGVATPVSDVVVPLLAAASDGL